MELVAADVDMIGTPEIAKLIDDWGKRNSQGMTRSTTSVQLFLRSVKNHLCSLRVWSRVVNSLVELCSKANSKTLLNIFCIRSVTFTFHMTIT